MPYGDVEPVDESAADSASAPESAIWRRFSARLLAIAWPGHPRRWRDVPRRLQPVVSQIARLTIAATLAYVLSVLITGVATDLTGALTALLVVQATNFSTLRMAVLRVGAVLTGVMVAVLLSTWFGLAWWSLAAAVAAALLLAKIFRLGDQALEAPISAMLILAVHGQDVAATSRIVSTLIGTAVGVGFRLLLPPPVPMRQAATEIGRVAATASTLLREAAASMWQRPISKPIAEQWLSRSRVLTRQIARADQRVGEVGDARRLNPRAIGMVNPEPLLRAGLTSLERVVFAIRALFSVVHQEAPAQETPDDGFGDELRQAFAVVLDTLADCIRDFGDLIEADIAGVVSEAEKQLRNGLELLNELRAILTEMMLVDPQTETDLWLLRGSVLAAVEQVLQQLDVGTHARMRGDLLRDRRVPDPLVPVADWWRGGLRI